MRYSKQGKAVYYPHLGVVEAFERALLIAAAPVSHTEGFNPAPRIEITQPLPLGVSSTAEVALVVLAANLPAWVADPSCEALLATLNASLPSGLLVSSIFHEVHLETGQRRKSIGSLQWGNRFRIRSLGEASSPIEDATRLLESAARNSGFDSLDIQFDAGAITLDLPVPAKREQGLMRLLSSAFSLENPLLSFSVEKVESIACIGNSKSSLEIALRG